jgi:hypothetical protein
MLRMYVILFRGLVKLIDSAKIDNFEFSINRYKRPYFI